MNLPINLRSTQKNHYHLELCDAETGQVKQVVDCHNVVLNISYDRLLAGGDISVSGIALGTGSEVPNAADTQIANRIWSAQATENVLTTTFPTAKRVLSVTVPAGEAIGALTRCAVGNHQDYWGWDTPATTHALFVDSEGNPIVINKTSTDILKITVTLYYSLTEITNPGADVFPSNTEDNIIYRTMVGLDMMSLSSCSIQYLMHKATKYTVENFGPYCESMGVAPAIVDGVASTGDCTQLYSAGNQWHNGLGYEIKAVTLVGVGTFNITAENFPPRAIGRYQLGIGDGSNKEFNIKTPSAIAGTQIVRIDGVVKTAGVDYTFYPFNMVDFYTNYPSTDRNKATYQVEIVGVNESCGGPFYPRNVGGGGWLFERVIVTDTKPITYDFGVPITVNCFYGPADTLSTFVGVQIESSTDGTNWVPFMTITEAMHNPVDLVYIHTRAAVTARYWRYIAPDSTPRFLMNYYTEGPTCGFGNYAPSVTFVTPPPINAVVDIDYNIAYPFKNNMHSVTTNIGMEFGR